MVAEKALEKIRRSAIRRCATWSWTSPWHGRRLKRQSRRPPSARGDRAVDRHRGVASAGLIATVLSWHAAHCPDPGTAQFTLSLADLPEGNQPVAADPFARRSVLVFLASNANGTPPSGSAAQLGEPNGYPHEGTDGTAIWSPDGRWIGFHAGGKLKKVVPSGDRRKRSPSYPDSSRLPGASMAHHLPLHQPRPVIPCR